jgi:hypothetical protein
MIERTYMREIDIVCIGDDVHFISTVRVLSSGEMEKTKRWEQKKGIYMK